MNIGIVGLGTIGGSLAKAIRANTGHTVYGFDRDPDTVAFACMETVIHGVLNEQTLPDCDLILTAIYPEATVSYLQSICKQVKQGATVMDCCGIKRAIFDRCRAIGEENGFCFLGGHPMAGAVATGFRASREKMFKNASMILVSRENESLLVLDRVYGLFRDIGFSKVVSATPEQHDRMIAFTSQLPHIISNAYVKSPVSSNHRGFSAGSFRDMARVAQLNVPMWTELFLENADYLADELGIFIDHLTAYKQALQAKDEQTLSALLAEGATCKAAADASATPKP